MKAVADIGELIGRGALISVLMVVIILPQFLALFDKLITRKMKENESDEINTVIEKKEDTNNKKEEKIKTNEKAKIKPREYVKNRHQKYKEWRAKSRDKILTKVIEKAEKLKQENDNQISLFNAEAQEEKKEEVKNEKSNK